MPSATDSRSDHAPATACHDIPLQVRQQTRKRAVARALLALCCTFYKLGRKHPTLFDARTHGFVHMLDCKAGRGSIALFTWSS